MKIINYLFKRSTNRFEDIELIILKSNIPFPKIDSAETTIEIDNEGKNVKVVGKYHHAVIAAGVYDLAFSIRGENLTDI